MLIAIEICRKIIEFYKGSDKIKFALTAGVAKCTKYLLLL